MKRTYEHISLPSFLPPAVCVCLCACVPVCMCGVFVGAGFSTRVSFLSLCSWCVPARLVLFLFLGEIV